METFAGKLRTYCSSTTRETQREGKFNLGLGVLTPGATLPAGGAATLRAVHIHNETATYHDRLNGKVARSLKGLLHANHQTPL